MAESASKDRGATYRVILVGYPNVGKSALFNQLTGSYATVSNYPGTTVEVFTGPAPALGPAWQIVDTPGVYSLSPITEEERVTRNVLLSEPVHAVVHVVDAKNLGRMLGLTLQLAETGLPLVLALNMYDEALDLGLSIDAARLQELLGIPVVATVSLTGKGVKELCRSISKARPSAAPIQVNYGPALARAVSRVASRLIAPSAISAHSRALLLLQRDAEERKTLLLDYPDSDAAVILHEIASELAAIGRSPHYLVAQAVKAQADRLVAETFKSRHDRKGRGREFANRLCMNPVSGWLILTIVMYAGFYQIIGRLGAGTLVDFLDGTVFQKWIVPWTAGLTDAWIPWHWLRTLVCGDYGLVSLGLRYAFAIVLPIVALYFLVFAVIEDSGYLPRLAMLTDRLFKRIGLTGRAVIPIVLGFGCDTMATVVTRTLETVRERIIATMILALAVPCSAQLGVVLGLLSPHPRGLLVWAAFITGSSVLASVLMARLLPGPRPSFYMEMPPLRWPRPANVFVKTGARLVWYFKEIIPIFLFASVLLWLGNLTGIFDVLVRAGRPVVRWLGLPDQTATVFLFGFFRRDYGAAGLYDLQHAGAMTPNQLVVATITLTLFLPCIAQFLVMKNERGWKTTLIMSATIFVTAFAGGWLAKTLLDITGMQL